MIINSYVFGPSYDPDAQAFFTASGLTGATNLNAINQLVVDLKGYGIWTKMKAIYPFIGGTAALHKWNLKDPQDTNAAFRLVFSGGWTHSSTGALPNGTNAFANTYLSTSAMALNSAHISYYSRTNNTTAATEIGGGQGTPTQSYTLMQLRGPNNPSNTFIWINNGDPVNNVTGVNTAAFFIGSRTASNAIKLFRNNTTTINGSAGSVSTSTNALYIGAYNNANMSTLFFSNRECAFSSIGDGLTDTEAANFYTAVQAYQTTLSRNV